MLTLADRLGLSLDDLEDAWLTSLLQSLHPIWDDGGRAVGVAIVCQSAARQIRRLSPDCAAMVRDAVEAANGGDEDVCKSVAAVAYEAMRAALTPEQPGYLLASRVALCGRSASDCEWAAAVATRIAGCNPQREREMQRRALIRAMGMAADAVARRPIHEIVESWFPAR